MLTVEQVIAAQKSQLGTVFGATAKAYEGLEKLVELNLQTGKAALSEAAEAASNALSVRDPQQLLAFQTTGVQPAVEKLGAYGRQVYEILSTTQAEVAQIAESAAAEAQKTFASSLDSVVKNAPAGSEGAIAFMQSAVSAANSAYDALQKAVKQAAEATEANVQAAAANATKAAGPRAKRAA
jgi:phasin family protein